MIQTKLIWNTLDKRFEVELYVSMAPSRWQKIVEDFFHSKVDIKSIGLTPAMKKKLGINKLKPGDIIYD